MFEEMLLKVAPRAHIKGRNLRYNAGEILSKLLAGNSSTRK